MTPSDDEPWFHAALQLLDLRPQDRVLAIGCAPAQLHAIAAAVGKLGSVTGAHPADRARVSGLFDALIVLTTCGPAPSAGRHVEFALRHLRPGGRCVCDLPGRDMVPELGAAAAELGWPAARLGALHGIGDDDLAASLQNAGLRGVRGVLGSHLLRFAGPVDLVDRFAFALDLTDLERSDIERVLVARAGGTGPIDVLVHRTRLQAIR